MVCADGGANRALDLGLTPLAVIGDLDSASEAARAAFSDRLHRIDDPDTTDFEKILQTVSAPLILGLGFLGGRLDHTLATLNVLARHALRPVILFGEDELIFRAPADVTLTLPPATPFALLPMGATRVTTTGLRWNLTDAVLTPDGRVSSSNETADPEVRVTSSGPLFLTLPLEHLPVATDAVLGR